MINYVFNAQGHSNVSSRHRSTLEITLDKDIGKKADCIVGVKADKSMLDFPPELKSALCRDEARVKVILSSPHSEDEIVGQGHPSLILNHPTDMVCRKSEYICNRTLMIRASKAACDLNPDLIQDLKNGEKLKVEIQVQ